MSLRPTATLPTLGRQKTPATNNLRDDVQALPAERLQGSAVGVAVQADGDQPHRVRRA